MRACVRSCVRACVRAYMRACMRTYVGAYIRMYVCTMYACERSIATANAVLHLLASERGLVISSRRFFGVLKMYQSMSFCSSVV